jgi:hypothetical protein
MVTNSILDYVGTPTSRLVAALSHLENLSNAIGKKNFGLAVLEIITLTLPSFNLILLLLPGQKLVETKSI